MCEGGVSSKNLIYRFIHRFFVPICFGRRKEKLWAVALSIEKDISCAYGRTRKDEHTHHQRVYVPSRNGAVTSFSDHPDVLLLDLLSEEILGTNRSIRSYTDPGVLPDSGRGPLT